MDLVLEKIGFRYDINDGFEMISYTFALPKGSPKAAVIERFRTLELIVDERFGTTNTKERVGILTTSRMQGGYRYQRKRDGDGIDLTQERETLTLEYTMDQTLGTQDREITAYHQGGSPSLLELLDRFNGIEGLLRTSDAERTLRMIAALRERDVTTYELLLLQEQS